VIAHPIMSGPGAALPAIWDGNAKMPLPIIDPTTRAVRATTPRPALGPLGRVSAGLAIVFCDIVDSPVGRRAVAGGESHD
jgi:hypothetical protein